jgi:hypothetical protein
MTGQEQRTRTRKTIINDRVGQQQRGGGYKRVMLMENMKDKDHIFGCAMNRNK